MRSDWGPACEELVVTGDKAKVGVALSGGDLDGLSIDELEDLTGNRTDAVLLAFVSRSAAAVRGDGPQAGVTLELPGRLARGSFRTRIAGPGSPLGEVLCQTGRGLAVRVPADKLLGWSVKMLAARGVRVTLSGGAATSSEE